MKKAKPTFDLPPRPGFARMLGGAKGGRSDELRAGERLRNDKGGGPRGDGMPNVPHGDSDALPRPPRRGEG